MAGAALGPLVTGYVLLHSLSLQQSFLVICAVQCAAAVFFTLALKAKPRHGVLAGVGTLLALGGALASTLQDPPRLGAVGQPNRRARRHGG